MSTKSESAKPNTAVSTYWFCACSGGAGPSASRVMKQLATKISEKCGKYADTISYIRTKFSFALLRSCVFCLRGCRALKPRVPSETSISAAVEEGRLH